MGWGSSIDIESGFSRLGERNCAAYSKRRWRLDGKGAWRDNAFIERLWSSIRYEEVYLRAYETVGEARGSIGRYLEFYNGRRSHSSLDGSTPDQAYFNSLPLRLAA
jgi:putative transposase